MATIAGEDTSVPDQELAEADRQRGRQTAGRQRTLPATDSAHAHVEIACDESGFSGGSLFGGPGTVFSHASVRLEPGAATALVEHIRGRVGAPVAELKSAQLHRPRHRAVVVWLLHPDGPLRDRARVHLTDTEFFAVARLVDLLLGPEIVDGATSPGRRADTRAVALLLYERGPAVYGAGPWREFLVRATDLMRTRKPRRSRAALDAFFDAAAAMARAPGTGPVVDAVRRISHSRGVAVTAKIRHEADPRRPPLTEPVLPALAHAVDVWGRLGESISVVHDEQSALTPARMRHIADTFAARHPGHRLADVRLVDSRADPRVQVADLLAGIARRQALLELAGEGDAEVTTLLRGFVDPDSTWADARSWSALGPQAAADPTSTGR